MKTDIHLWSYFAGFFLEWEMFHTKVVEIIKTRILRSIIFFENRAVYETSWKKKYCTAWQAKIWCMRIACYIPKATITYPEYIKLTAFSPYSNGYTNAPQCYVIRTLSVLVLLKLTGRLWSLLQWPTQRKPQCYWLAHGRLNLVPYSWLLWNWGRGRDFQCSSSGTPLKCTVTVCN